MIRTLGGIAAGLAAAIALMMITEAIGNQIAPTSLPLDLGEMGEAQPVPVLTLLFPIIGWFLGALIGGWLSIRISDRPWTAWAIAAVVLVAIAFNFVMMSYPVWVIVIGLLGAPLGGWLAQRLCAMADRASSA